MAGGRGVLHVGVVIADRRGGGIPDGGSDEQQPELVARSEAGGDEAPIGGDFLLRVCSGIETKQGDAGDNEGDECATNWTEGARVARNVAVSACVASDPPMPRVATANTFTT